MANCPQCGASLSTDTSGGLCPACLLKRGLEPNTVPPTMASASGWAPPTVEELAPFFPELDILSLLGRGGMGAVYKARQKSLDRIVALKILPPQISHDPNFSQRFAQEAQALAKLNHPHIVAIYDYGQRTVGEGTAGGEGAQGVTHVAGALFFFLMEYVDGVSLRQLLDGSRLDSKDALAIVPQICDALQYAHDRRIVHRDIKPENILLTRAGQIKIADFGIATLVDAEGVSVEARGVSIAGTPQYMAPEQSASPEAVDHRADIYALGVVFYQMLTGELPPNPLTPPSAKVRIDVRLDEIVLRALERSPELRFQNATELKTQVETVLSEPRAADGVISGGSGTVRPPAENDGLAGTRGAVAQSLRIPAIGLRIAAVLNLIGLLAMTLGLAFVGISAVPRAGGYPTLQVMVLVPVVLGVVLNLLILRAGVNLGRLQHFGFCVAGCILAFLAIPGNILALPFAIWAMVILSRAETRAAFDQPGPIPPVGSRHRRVSQAQRPLEFRTRATLLGLPLVHVTGGMDWETNRPRVAHGIIAIGPLARGFVAIGGIAYGFFAFGGIATGVVAIGGLGAGIVVLAGISVGLIAPGAGLALAVLYASGGLVVAPKAYGGLAIGREAAGGVVLPLQPWLAIPMFLAAVLSIATCFYFAEKLCSAPPSSDRRYRRLRGFLVAISCVFVMAVSYVLADRYDPASGVTGYPTGRTATQPVDPALQIKQNYAEDALRDMEAKYKMGRLSFTEYRRAKLDRDIAAAAVAGDKSAVSRLKLEYANEVLEDAMRRRAAGIIGQSEYIHAVNERDIAMAEVTGDAATIAQAKYRAAQNELGLVESEFKVGLVTGDELRSAQLARDSAAAGTQPGR